MSSKRNRSNQKPVSEQEALVSVFGLSNGELAEKIGKPYHTIGTWRFKYLNNKLSESHKVLILQSLNYELQNERVWLKKQ